MPSNVSVCGFTIVRNALKYDYPVVESILSMLPLVDKLYIGLGESEDDTEALIRSIASEKIEIIPSVWDMNLREGGKVLAVETNKVFDAIPEEAFDWCIYLQADEVFPASAFPIIRKGMETYAQDIRVEGLLLEYRHFYGTYDYVANSTNWYRREIRIVRNNKGIRSYRDAQGFRWLNNRKLKVKLLKGAFVHHYGWVKNPKAMQAKVENFNKLWHSDEWVAQNIAQQELFDYSQFDSLEKFTADTHPEVMRKRIENQNWQLNADPTKKRMKPKAAFKYLCYKYLNWIPFEYKNYTLL